MASELASVAFAGVEARRVAVQAQLTGGTPSFVLVGLGDKAVVESRERVRAAFACLGLALPEGRVIVSLAPGDMPKEGSHFDLPIALTLLVAAGVLSADQVMDVLAFGELGLDGALASTPGVLPAAIAAQAAGLRFACAAEAGSEAAWSGARVLAAPSLMALITHLRGGRALPDPAPGEAAMEGDGLDLRDVKGQETAKRALEIAAAGGHNLLLAGPPGAGKSMLAARLPGLLPPLSPEELLDVSMIHSVAGLLERGRLTRARPFRNPHHSASMAALVGGGLRAKPGEVSLAHRGVLFLDELPEFSPQALDALRQPLESGVAVVARANHHVRYPARFQLIAAMNTCRCGGPADCRRGPRCAAAYQGRLSGPLLDRIDLQLDVPAVTAADLALPPAAEGTREVAARVARARERQAARAAAMSLAPGTLNAALPPSALEQAARPDPAGAALLEQAAQALRLSARGYHRTLKAARTIADLEDCAGVRRQHLAEALSLRRQWANALVSIS